jgi:hypothetical protein
MQPFLIVFKLMTRCLFVFDGKDWEIVFGSKSDFNVASIYDKWDPLIIGVDNIQPLIDNTTAE